MVGHEWVICKSSGSVFGIGSFMVVVWFRMFLAHFVFFVIVGISNTLFRIDNSSERSLRRDMFFTVNAIFLGNQINDSAVVVVFFAVFIEKNVPTYSDVVITYVSKNINYGTAQRLRIGRKLGKAG
jgi:hypothetical protein